MIEILKTYLKERNTSKVESLVEERPEILDMRDENGSSVFQLIAYSGMPTIFEKAKTLKSSFTFHEAIMSGKMEIVKNQLEQSKENFANKYSSDGFTPLSLAAFFDQDEIAKLLLTHKANPNLVAKNPSKVNALHSAVAKENYNLCALFLKYKVDVNATQTQSVTALHSAVHRGNLKLTKLLVENGADIHAKMKNGDTPLAIAQREKHNIIEKYFQQIKS